ncbi:MAG: DUF1822 family protein [Nostocaceae cyanobacterium]|nr:DUF1822 family protein [Nostocaceae cyanobacterium]
MKPVSISPVNSSNLRLPCSEVIYLESEYFEQAITSDSPTGDWQTYLNTLAEISLTEWLRTRLLNQVVTRHDNFIQVDGFKIQAIATENLLDELVSIPQLAIDQPELAAHFYVVLEVVEEQEQAIIRGFLRHDQLKREARQLRDDCYQIPLDVFDAEPNHLLSYCRLLSPSTIPLAVVAKKSEQIRVYIEESKTKLSQWLQGVVEEGWLAIDALMGTNANLAWSTRNADTDFRRGKLIDLGMQLDNQNVALLVKIAQEPEEKLGVLVQLHPTGGETYLPQHLRLTLLSKTGTNLQEVQARSLDNYIQLKSFKAKAGSRFSIEVRLNDTSIIEDFEV